MDDSVFSNYDDHFNVVLNAGNKITDLEHAKNIQASEFGGLDLALEYVEDESLIAIQGPRAVEIIQKLVGKDLSKMGFMNCAKFYSEILGSELVVSRCGYTGEDGFELSVKDDAVVNLAEYVFDHFDFLKPAGLGARDLLRMEAGLNLHGHDISTDINPVEALLMWTVRKSNAFVPFVGQERLMEIKEVSQSIIVLESCPLLYLATVQNIYKHI